MNRENTTLAKAGFRRLGAAILLSGLFLAAIYLGGQNFFGLSIISEEKVPAVNWETLLGELGYSLREENISGQAENRQEGDRQQDVQQEEYPEGETQYAQGEVRQAEASHGTAALNLYARAAVLLDGDSGRVLYGKEENTQLPMASTTKIMTCIVALENGNLEDEVTVSSYAASQPEVRMGIRSGETYVLKDLLYAMMLTSYNDCAVAIAEHIGGTVENFAAMMNQKARDLGCYSTWYITPNGLDGENEGGIHSTTAADLARVLAYAIRNEAFLEITRASSHSFTNGSGKRSFTAVNKNAFLTMMEGALSGKTGFTNGAGYCYAGALSRDGKTLIAAVLGSGWPPNKTWKWSDTRALMNYGMNTFSPITVGNDDWVTEISLPVENGVNASVKIELDWSERTLLAAEDERVTAAVQIPDKLTAPVPEGAVVGTLSLYLEEEPVLCISAVTAEAAELFSLRFCAEQIISGFVFDIQNN